jgi:hypothetical protein
MFDDSELNQSAINSSSVSASVTSSATITGYCCNLCKKSYTRKSSLDKHKLLCDYKTKSKLEHKVEDEELGDTPTYEQLVKIVQELAFKYVKLEEKIEQMQVWVSQKKQKIKVIDLKLHHRLHCHS